MTIYWPGRLQKLRDEPFRQHALKTQEVWLDGGHNDSAGMMLAQQCKNWKRTEPRALHLIIAMVNRKNPAEFLEPLVPYVESITVTKIESESSSYHEDELYNLVEPLGFKKLTKASNAQQALKNIKEPNVRILLAGSLYFIGEILT